MLRPELVETITQVLGLRAPEFVAGLLESFEAYENLHAGLLLQAVEPCEERDRSVRLPEQDQSGARQAPSCIIRDFTNNIKGALVSGATDELPRRSQCDKPGIQAAGVLRSWAAARIVATTATAAMTM